MSLGTTPLLRRAGHAAAATALAALVASCGGDTRREVTAPDAVTVAASVEGGEFTRPTPEQITDISEEHSSHIDVPKLASALGSPAVVGLLHRGGHFQVDVATASRVGFPTQGSSYLIVSSGDARNPEFGGSAGNTGCVGDFTFQTLCNVGGLDVSVAVPAGAQELTFDLQYFTWDYVPYEDPFRVYLIAPGYFGLLEEFTNTSEFGGKHTAAFAIAPTRRTVTIGVAAFAGQTITVRLQASDRYDQGLNSGALIDNFAIDGNVPPNSPPQVNITGAPYATTEGAGIVLTAVASDANPGDVLSYDWDFGDGSAHATSLNAPHTYDDGSYSYTATLTVSDGKGGVATASTVVAVANVAPTASFSAPAGAIDEGGSFSISLDGATDVSGADVAAGFTYALDCGDGNTSTGGIATLTCLAPDNLPRTVTATITDKDGGSTAYSADVTINNVAPSVEAGAGATILSGQSFSLNGEFSDPGAFDGPWSFNINWSDGSPTAGSSPTQGAINASHTYLRAGTYTVTLSVTDKDRGTGADATSVVVERIPVGGPAGYEVINIEGVGQGMVTIDVLSTSSVDATTIVASTATFGNEIGAETGVERRNNGTYMTTVQDLDGDGRMDLSLKFRRDALRNTGDLNESTDHLILLADLSDGRQVRGVYNVRTVPK